jgi:ribonuclease P protein subunit RPR2
MTKAKAKLSKETGNIPNKILHCRASYLYQAATYLATQKRHSKALASPATTAANNSQLSSKSVFDPASRRLVSDLRSISLKAQIRMSPAMKHSICKNCDTMLTDGSTCSIEIENKSKGGKKSWADVLVRKCNICGFTRRYPMAAERQKRKRGSLTVDRTGPVSGIANLSSMDE